MRIEVKELLAWRAKGKGILGCELAEGWANRISKSYSKPPLPAPKEAEQANVAPQQHSSDRLEQMSSPQPEIREEVD